MLVLHAHWQPPAQPAGRGSVLIWAEDGAVLPPASPRGRASSRPRLHPSCPRIETLTGILSALLGPAGEPLPGQQGSAELLLPSGRAGPQASPQLVTDWPPSDAGPLSLRAWLVPGWWLPEAPALALLARLPLTGNLPAGSSSAGAAENGSASSAAEVAIGADARFWHLAAGLVLETLAQQKLAPTFAVRTEARPVYQARWQATLDAPADVARLARLAAAMPPVCRAGVPALTPRELLDTFINGTVDAMARRAAARAPRLRPIAGNVPASRWLAALAGENDQVQAAAGQAQALQRSVSTWLRQLQVAGSGDFRAAFRLAPPDIADGSADGWQLHYLLQARHDLSLLVPADQVWNTRGAQLDLLGRERDRAQERLLAALGYAARLFPPLGRSLRSARPDSLALEPDEAFTFLRETGPLLEQSGFGVLVPPWWNRPGSRLALRLRARPSRSSADHVAGRLSFQQLVEYEWQLSVGDTTLTPEEFRALVALKSPLVQIRGQWVQLDSEQIEAALRFWKTQDWRGETDLLAALQMGLSPTDASGALPVESVEFEDGLHGWLEQLTGAEPLEELPQPAGLAGQLRPYQRYGYSWLHFLRRQGLGACLADDMGLGKTITTISLLQRDHETQQADGPVLLICPTSIVGNWQREVARFGPELRVLAHHGFERLHGEEFAAAAAENDLVLTNYALARRDADTLGAVAWRGVVLDEAQNIKNPTAQQTQAIRRLQAGFRIALTGTPVENRLSELWSIMQFLNPGYLGPRERFRQAFSLPVERYGDEEAARRLKRLVSPFILRRVKTDPRVIADLPDKLEMKVFCNLTEEQATLYQAVVTESLAELETATGTDRRGQVLAMLLKLKQVCNHPAQFLHQAPAGGAALHEMAGRSGKLERLVEMLEEALAAGDKALVFTQFAEWGQALQGYLQAAMGRPVLFLHGGTPAARRDEMVARFQSPDGPPIFVLSLKAGGVGLNLTQANHVFHFDRWWNPAVEDQATDRAFRIGQTRNVQVHKFVCTGTLEEMIDDMIESKRGLARAIVGSSGEAWLTELSTDQLRELVTLRREAVG